MDALVLFFFAKNAKNAKSKFYAKNAKTSQNKQKKFF